MTSFVPIPLWDPKNAFAVNVDPTKDGGVKARDGYRTAIPLQAEVGVAVGGRGLVQSGTRLFEIRMGGTGPEASWIDGTGALTPVFAEDHLAMVVYGERMFWSNGTDRGVITNGRSRPWGMERPGGVEATVVGGGMIRGRYLIGVTHVRDDGYESSPSLPLPVELPDGGSSILVSGLSAGLSATVALVNIYMTFPDGDRYRMVATVAGGVDEVTINTDGPLGEPLPDELEGDPPPGELRWMTIAWGVVAVSVDRTLFWSAADPERFRPEEHFLMLPDRITGLGWVGDGVIIGTDSSVYRLSGGLPFEGNTESSMVKIGDHGMVDGSLALDPGNHNQIMYTDRAGKIFAATGGGQLQLAGELGLTTLPWIAARAGIFLVSGASKYLLSPILEPTVGGLAITVPAPTISSS